MNIPHWVINTVITVSVATAIVWVAFVTVPKTDNCAPRLIARYTNVIISHKDCIALGAQCIITPADVRKFNIRRIQLQECVIEIGGGKEK